MRAKRFATLIVISVLAASAAQAQNLFRVKFQATCRPGDNGKSSSKMNTRDLIAQCVGTGFSNHDLDQNFELVYNATADSLQVVNESDGSVVCDVFQFQADAATLNRDANGKNDNLERLVFVFRPGEATSIGTATITEKPQNTSNNNVTKARINGKIQFTSPLLASNLTSSVNSLTSNNSSGNNDNSGNNNNSADTNNALTTISNLVMGTTGNNGTGNTGAGNNLDNSSNNNNNNSTAANTLATTGNTRFVQASVAAPSLEAVQICSGTFSAGKEFIPGANQNKNNKNNKNKNNNNNSNSNTNTNDNSTTTSTTTTTTTTTGDGSSTNATSGTITTNQTTITTTNGLTLP